MLKTIKSVWIRNKKKSLYFVVSKLLGNTSYIYDTSFRLYISYKKNILFTLTNVFKSVILNQRNVTMAERKSLAKLQRNSSLAHKVCWMTLCFQNAYNNQPVKWLLPWRRNCHSVNLTNRLQLATTLRMFSASPIFPYTPSWRAVRGFWAICITTIMIIIIK